MLAADFRRHARTQLKGFWGTALAVCLVAGLLGGLSTSGSVNFNANADTFTDYSYSMPSEAMQAFTLIFASIAGVLFVYSLAVFVLGSAINLGVNTFFCRTMLGERPAFSTLFSQFNIFGKALGLRLFTTFFVFLWTLLLFIPGIIASYRYAMASYIMAEYPQLGIREAVDRSKELMRDKKGRLFCLHLSFIGWQLLSVLTLGILSLWINPYIQAAEATFYLHITGRIAPATGAAPAQPQDDRETQSL